MHALRKSEWADFCNSVVNDAHRGRAEVPATVSAMYKVAIEHIPMFTGPSASASTSAVFATASKPAKYDQKPSSSQFKGRCIACDQQGHPIKDCPLVKQAQSMKTKDKPTGPSSSTSKTPSSNESKKKTKFAAPTLCDADDKVVFSSRVILEMNHDDDVSEPPLPQATDPDPNGDSDSEPLPDLISDCDSSDDEEAVVSVPHDPRVVVASLRGTPSTAVLLDNQANVSVFHNRDLLENIRDTRQTVTISGIGGDQVKTKQVGDLAEFFPVSYCADATVNVLSFSDVEEHLEITYERSVGWRVHLKDGTCLLFRRACDGLHICDFADHCSTRLVQSYATTVAELESEFTIREVEAAKGVRELMKRLGYPTPRDMVELLVSGSIVNCPYTAKDVARAEHIYGPAAASLKGKSVNSAVPRPNREVVPKSVQTSQSLHCDIFFWREETFLLSVAKPLSLSLCTRLSGRTASVVCKALANHVTTLRSQDFIVSTIFCDPEGGIVSAATQLPGVLCNPAGAGAHEPTAERKIRHIKERVRAIESGVPFTISKVLVQWIVYYAVTMVNCMPSRLTACRASPRELFSGLKLDYSKDTRLAFGDYVQVFNKNASVDERKPRTDGAIALLPGGNAQGSWRFLLLKNMQVVTRDHWTPSDA